MTPRRPYPSSPRTREGASPHHGEVVCVPPASTSAASPQSIPGPMGATANGVRGTCLVSLWRVSRGVLYWREGVAARCSSPHAVLPVLRRFDSPLWLPIASNGTASLRRVVCGARDSHTPPIWLTSTASEYRRVYAGSAAEKPSSCDYATNTCT